MFVVILCAVSLSASVAVLYVHLRSTSTVTALVMPKWVRL